MMAARTRTARRSQNQPAASATRSGGILEFIAQDDEARQALEWFEQLPSPSNSDIERLCAALTKAEAAWRRRDNNTS